ncbi:hypothetical protein AQUCO_06100018v1 [Aquilegia coerulea]|uniref:Uncharacterized protein n=1 Tax=Aquilegia coerulea TaxID=218851 RepID=A0A2G5CD89_AQUCA|nr:hypothetical protein AQUCO_06100018v1 [Aquilegia coerulea]
MFNTRINREPPNTFSGVHIVERWRTSALTIVKNQDPRHHFIILLTPNIDLFIFFVFIGLVDIKNFQ